MPVAIPEELMAAFHKSAGTPAPFGERITLADHCLQVATAVHQAAWVPELYRRDMVVMSLFHDIYFVDSAEAHGDMVARLLEGRIHPHVLGILQNHTELGCDPAELENKRKRGQSDQFAVSMHQMLDQFTQLDRETVHADCDWLPLDFFKEHGYFCLERADDANSRASYLSPNGTLIWAAPSMWIERTPILLAQRLGMFERAGLPPVELTITDGGPELVEHMRAGRVHIGELGMFPFLAAMDSAEPMPASLVGSTFIQQLDHYLAAVDPRITSIEHLRGCRVGVLSTGSCDSYLLQAMLAEAGVDPGEVETVPLGCNYGGAKVLREGHVDATFLVEPALSHAEDHGFAHVLTKASSIYPRFQWGGIVASHHIREKAPELLLQMLDVYRQSCIAMHAALAKEAEGRDCAVLAALRELGPTWFNVTDSTFLKALRRDAATWQLDWHSIDAVGAETCASIQRSLGVFRGDGPCIDDVCAVNLHKLHK